MPKLFKMSEKKKLCEITQFLASKLKIKKIMQKFMQTYFYNNHATIMQKYNKYALWIQYCKLLKKKLWKNYANMHPEKLRKFMNYKVMGNKLCKLTDITHLTQKLRKHPKITRFTYCPLCSFCRWINDNQWRFQVRASCQVYFQVLYCLLSFTARKESKKKRRCLGLQVKMSAVEARTKFQLAYKRTDHSLK